MRAAADLERLALVAGSARERGLEMLAGGSRAPRRRRMRRDRSAAVYSSSAASPRARTSAMIARDARHRHRDPARLRRRSAARARARSPARERVEPGDSGACAMLSACGCTAARHRVEQRLHRVALELQRGRIDDRARADRHDLLDRDEIVGLAACCRCDTRSTIASASPTSGASSIEP